MFILVNTQRCVYLYFVPEILKKSSSRGRPRNQRAHRAILDATLNILKTEGIRAASIERIAAESGVAKQTIYRWWDSRADIILEIMVERATLKIEPADTGSFRLDMQTFLKQFFRLTEVELRPLLGAQFVEILQKPEYGLRFRQTVSSWREDYYQEIFRRALGRAEISADSDREKYWEMISGFIWFRVMFPMAKISDEDAIFYANIIADQLGCD